MVDKLFEKFEDDLVKPEISMTPLIDMVFLLLVFFVVTTSFIKETGITVNKAQARTSELIQKNLFVIAVDKEGAYWYDRNRRQIEEIVATAKAEARRNKELTVVIVPDKEGRVEPLVSLLDRLRIDGINRFSLGTARSVDRD